MLEAVQTRYLATNNPGQQQKMLELLVGFVFCIFLLSKEVDAGGNTSISCSRTAMYRFHLQIALEAKSWADRFESQKVRNKVYAAQVSAVYQSVVPGTRVMALMPPISQHKALHRAIETHSTFEPFLMSNGQITFMAWIPGFPGGTFVAMPNHEFRGAIIFAHLMNPANLSIDFLSHATLPDPKIHETKPHLISPINNMYQSATLPTIENVIVLLKFMSLYIARHRNTHIPHFSTFFRPCSVEFGHIKKDWKVMVKPFQSIQDTDIPLAMKKDPDGIWDAMPLNITPFKNYLNVVLATSPNYVVVLRLRKSTKIADFPLKKFNESLSVIKRLISCNYKFSFPIDLLQTLQ